MPDKLHASSHGNHDAQEARPPFRVLIAEDHDSIRKGLLIAFKRAGYHCEVAADGREAREMLANTTPAFHLLVTDHEMPHANGLEIVRELRSRSDPTNVIVFSGSLTDTQARDYQKLGVAHIIAKPADFSELLQVAGSLRRPSPIR